MKQLTALVLVSLLLTIGCTHSARITNAKRFAPREVRPSKQVNLGFSPVIDDRLLTAAISRVKSDATVGECRDHFKFGGEFRPDYVCQLSRETRFKASGQNFFIAFPGFIVFTHALIGYKYTADITTHSRVFDSSSNQVSELSIHTPIQFRHCSFARGAAAGCCGWLLPGYGAAAIIPGAIFAASYDKRATSELTEKAEKVFGSYLASRILEQLALAQSNKTVSASLSRDLPVTDLQLSGADLESAEPNEFAVYVMKVDGNQISVPEVAVKTLPESVRETLAEMARRGVAADHEQLEELLTSLGLSPSEFFRRLDNARILSQQGEHLVELARKPQFNRISF
jgi:hypothetical protein